MSVAWTHAAIEDRQRFLDAAFERASEKEDPSIYHAALKADSSMNQESLALDGVATWREGPLEGTRLYVCRKAPYLLIYTRADDEVQIIRVAPTASNWSRSA